MKGQQTTCYYCKTSFTKKRQNHKYCQSKCRTLDYRKRKGIAEPSFLRKGVNKAPQSKPLELIASSQVQIKSPTDGLLLIEQQLAYYEGIISDAGANVFPLYMVGGAGAGAIAGKSGAEKLALGLLGGFIGKEFDVKRKARIIQTAHENVRLLKGQKRNLIAARSIAKQSIKIGAAKEERKGIIKVIDTNTYKQKNIPSLGMRKDSPWYFLVGDPSQNFCVMLHGLPGNGKSTFSIQFADYFQKNHGNVLYIASEQKGLNASFQGLLQEYVKSNFDISNDVKDHNYDKILQGAKDYKLVIVDSINHIGLTVKEFEDIREKSPNTAFICIMQSAKDGNFKGSQEWAHNCDIIIEMSKMIAHQTKSRYAPPAQIPIIR